VLKRMRCDRFDDLVASNALLRPGPLDAGMHNVYIRRKRGEEPTAYALPELEPILSNTYGVITYQEQVMRIAQVLAGISLAEADVLRKAVGLGPRPDTVEVGLAVAVTEPLARSGDVTEQDRERARQSTARVTAQHGLDRAEPGVFVAMEQHRYEQRRRAPSRETEERRTVEHAI